MDRKLCSTNTPCTGSNATVHMFQNQVSSSVFFQYFDSVTVLFAYLAGFNSMFAAETMEPMQFIKYLDLVFTTFDGILDKHSVFKVPLPFHVETINCLKDETPLWRWDLTLVLTSTFIQGLTSRPEQWNAEQGWQYSMKIPESVCRRACLLPRPTILCRCLTQTCPLRWQQLLPFRAVSFNQMLNWKTSSIWDFLWTKPTLHKNLQNNSVVFFLVMSIRIRFHLALNNFVSEGKG